MTRWSIRTRITALATLLASIVLAVAAVVVVLIVEEQLRDDLDRTLEQRADQIAAAADIEPSVALANSNDEDRFAQLLDATGEVLFSTANIDGEPALAPLPFAERASATRDDLPLEDDAYRVLVHRYGEGEATRFVVVGENIDEVRDGVRALQRTVTIVFPLAVLLLAGMVWWLVGRTLRPVERIRREVAAIGLDELDRRVPVPETGDEIAGLGATMNDMLARLEAAAEGQRRFVADVSHELRTPLTRLRTTLEVDLANPSADFVETARMALDDAVDMQTLVDDVLFLAHRDAGQVTTRRDPVDLDVVVETEVGRARAAAGAIRIDMSGVQPVQVAGDAGQLTRVVRNVLSNAVRHARHEVTVTLAEEGDTAVLLLADDGSGIAPADRARVFERFARLDEARSTREGGTGLGLAISREIVIAHDGTIEIGEAASGGAEVLIRLRVPASDRRPSGTS